MPSTFDLPLEDAIIGAICLEGAIPPPIRAVLSPDLFTTQERKVQIAAQVEAYDTLGSTDPIAVKEILSRQGQPLDVILDIIKLAELVPSSAHLAAHVQLLREFRGGVDQRLDVLAPQRLVPELICHVCLSSPHGYDGDGLSLCPVGETELPSHVEPVSS